MPGSAAPQSPRARSRDTDLRASRCRVPSARDRHRPGRHRIDRAGLTPLPVQRPNQVWMGGGGDRQTRTVVEPVLRRIARIADGWFTHLPANEDGRAGMAAFRRLVEEEGRDPAKLPVEGRLPAARSGVEDWKRGVEIFREIGLTGVELNTMGAGY